MLCKPGLWLTAVVAGRRGMEQNRNWKQVGEKKNTLCSFVDLPDLPECGKWAQVSIQ
jgi:hypothetical protein